MGVISFCHTTTITKSLTIQPALGALFNGGGVFVWDWNWQCRRPQHHLRRLTALTIAKSPLPTRRISSQMFTPSTYSSRISTDIPLYESAAATFDQYLEDKPRVFKAMFPDKNRSQQLNEHHSGESHIFVLDSIGRKNWDIGVDIDATGGSEYILEEWRVHMLPLQFGFLTVSPVIDMRLRCRSEGIEYPTGVPRHISKVLELDILRWDLQGLEIPSQFSLGIEGALYPDRRGTRSRLKGQLKITISYIVPPVLALVPEDIRRDIAKKVLKSLVENMKQKVNDSLLADYSRFKKERMVKLV